MLSCPGHKGTESAHLCSGRCAKVGFRWSRAGLEHHKESGGQAESLRTGKRVPAVQEEHGVKWDQ